MNEKSERFTGAAKACYIGFEVEVIQKMESYSLVRLGRREFIVETHDLTHFDIENIKPRGFFCKRRRDRKALARPYLTRSLDLCAIGPHLTNPSKLVG
jgi:hypothetical protein